MGAASADAPLGDAERSLLIEELERAAVGRGLSGSATATATLKSPSCGDEITVAVTVDDGRLSSLSWTGHGCTVSRASASALVTLVGDGMPVEQFRELAARFTATVQTDGIRDAELGDAEAFVGIGRFPLRGKCATLAWRATLVALDAPEAS